MSNIKVQLDVRFPGEQPHVVELKGRSAIIVMLPDDPAADVADIFAPTALETPGDVVPAVVALLEAARMALDDAGFDGKGVVEQAVGIIWRRAGARGRVGRRLI